MKFVSLYSNKEDIFPTINFKSGFNVIFARVKDPSIKKQDSHNLGKSFLIKVIDFALLAGIDKSHAFKKNDILFKDFIFFIQIKTDSGSFVVVKRPVSGRTNISINVSSIRQDSLLSLNEDQWTYSKLSVAAAKNELDSLLNLEVINGFDYRKGLGYFLRSQSDYAEVFRISKFISGADVYWKPFIAKILGFDRALVEKKYKQEAELSKLQTKLETVEDEAGSKSEEFDEVRGILKIKEDASRKMSQELNAFSFREVESQLNESLVSDIESNISERNKRRYTIDYELQELKKSLNKGIEFDIQKIRALFEEIQIELPHSLVRDYEEIVEFNRRMSSGRIARLRELQGKLSEERVIVEQAIRQLDIQRQEATAILNENQMLEKYRRLQKRFGQQEAEVIELRQRLTQLDRAGAIQQEVESQKQEVVEVGKKLRENVRKENSIYTRIRTTFSECVERILSVQALMSVTVNQNGNLDFNVRTLDRDSQDRETNEGAGNSYKKILCASFDLAVLRSYAERDFYHFVYHDGIFEGLDNRKKVELLELARTSCANDGIQYILTVIDSDLPRDERDQKLLFTADEIIRELHDQGKEGRLFRMDAF